MSEEFTAELLDWLKREMQSIENYKDRNAFLAGYLGALTNALDFIQGQDVYFTYLNSLEEEETNA
jgi:hypothetical protein